MDIRRANSADLNALNALEQQLFDGDRISPRQMKRFLHSDHAALFVADAERPAGGICIASISSRYTAIKIVFDCRKT